MAGSDHIAVLLLLASLPFAATSLKPTKSFETSFQVNQPPLIPFDAVQSVVDFPPNASVARHTHGGPLYAVMLKGSIELWIDGAPVQTLHEGDPIVEPYRNISSAANLDKSPASLLATYLIPVGAQLTVFEPGADNVSSLGPSSRFQSRMRFDSAPDEYMVRIFLLTYEVGAWTVPETVVAPRLITVVSGEVTRFGRRYAAAEVWIERPGERSLASGNVGPSKAVVAVSVVPT